MTTAYGSITVSGLTDIADIYFEYALAVDSANVTNSYPFNQTGELGWTVNGESRKIPPTWESGYKVWVREVKVKTDIVTKIYGNPYPDTAINQTNVDLAALQTKVKKIWSNSSGSYMASGIGNNDVDTATVSTYGFNSRTTTGGISFNYNAIPLTELGTSGLKLYIPTISNNTVTSSNLGVELTTSALKFYDPTYHKAAMILTGSSLTFNKPNTTTAAAALDSNGLVLSSGGIKAGTFNNQSSSNRFIYLSTGDYGSSITINGHSASNWRAIIGTKFGVDSEGNLYASSANITGAIVATSLDLTTNNVKIGAGSVNGLASVATTGSYNDLSNKPTIPSLTGYIYENGTVGNTPAEGATGFVVSSSGALQASNAIIYGSLYASAGYVGGWRIGTDGNKTLHNGNTDTSPVPGEGVIILSKGITNSTATGLLPANKTWAFTAGNNFGVTTDGILYTNGANITNINGANITANTITIGSFSEDTQFDILNDNVHVPSTVAELTDKDNYTLKTIFDALDEYVNSHMVLEENELSILSNSTAAKIVLGLNGLSIYGTNGIVAQYGEDAIIGDPEGFHITITADYNNTGFPRLSFYRGPTNPNNEVAYISENKLYITQSVVLQQMDIGTKMINGIGGQWSWKVHEVNSKNNLYLKWLG